jgi:hypothetical protein
LSLRRYLDAGVGDWLAGIAIQHGAGNDPTRGAILDKTCLHQRRGTSRLAACRVPSGAADDRSEAYWENAATFDHLLDINTE